ncbi:MAG TPA: PP2C family protein-serine/threonine phosphatase [Candidatus Polarisedimenticolia bacterium]|nr:PP2C family protein-serine/threonine phosphatase [Candidatus Polarisedimenticolia bacterium]
MTSFYLDRLNFYAAAPYRPGVATNLWKDLDALLRLSATARAVETGWGGLEAEDGATGLLPRSEAAGWALAAAERPARVVSGDLVDAFPLGDHGLAFAIGDVSGKGIPAGLLRAFVRPILRQVAPLSASPGETLTHLNRILCGARLDALYLTLFLGWLDLPSGTLTYANAGHPPPIRIDAAGARPTGRPTGPILGILDARTFETGRLDLEAGDLLTLYTDGVSEAARRRSRPLGSDGLAALLSRNGRAAPEEISRTVLATVDRIEGGRPGDDATVLTIRVGDAPAAALRAV